MPLPPSPTPSTIIAALIELHAAENAAAQLQRLSPKARDRIVTARAKIPAPILGHHDRMRARGRKSVAPARHGVCTACHLALSGGAWNHLKKGTDLVLCENCGTYIYYEEDLRPAPAAATPPSPLPQRKIKPARALKAAPAKSSARTPRAVRLGKR